MKQSRMGGAFVKSGVAGQPAAKYHKESTLFEAAAEGDIKRLAVIIHESENVINATDYHQRTALHIACTRGHTDAVLYLLRNKADGNMKDCCTQRGYFAKTWSCCRCSPRRRIGSVR